MNRMDRWLIAAAFPVAGAFVAMTPLGAAAQQLYTGDSGSALIAANSPVYAAATTWEGFFPADAQSARQDREPNVTLQFRLIEADGFDQTDPLIEDIVQELRGVFRFEGYRLFDSALVSAAVPSHANTRMGDPERSYEVSANLDETSDGARVRVSVSLVSDATIVLPNGEVRRVGEILSASVNVADGQTVILGSGRPSGAEATLILAMTATISD